MENGADVQCKYGKVLGIYLESFDLQIRLTYIRNNKTLYTTYTLFYRVCRKCGYDTFMQMTLVMKLQKEHYNITFYCTKFIRSLSIIKHTLNKGNIYHLLTGKYK